VWLSLARGEMAVLLRAACCALLVALCSGCQGDTISDASLAHALIEGQQPQWASYPAYLRRAIARVQKQWERELLASREPFPDGGVGTVVFWLSADGKVSRIEDVKSAPEGRGAKACVAAITLPGTFPPWTKEMKAALEPEERMTFTFRYEDQPKEAS